MGSRRTNRAAGGLVALALLVAACSLDDGSATSADSTTTSLFPGSPEPSAGVVAGLKGAHASFIQRPAQVGLVPDAIAGDAGPLVEAVDPERLESDLAVLAIERGPADEDGHTAVMEHVAAEFAPLGLDRAAEDGSGELADPVVSVKGTECPDRTVVVAARVGAPEGSPGADRNASGAAVLLESARVLSEAPLPASVTFVALEPESGGAEKVLADLDDGTEAVAWLDLDGVGVTSTEEDPILAIEHAYLLMATDSEDDYLARVAALSTARFLPGFWAWGAVFPEERRDDLGVRDSAAVDEAVANIVFSDGGRWRDERVGTEEDTTEIVDLDFLANSTRSVLATLVGIATIDTDGDGQSDICRPD